MEFGLLRPNYAATCGVGIGLSTNRSGTRGPHKGSLDLNNPPGLQKYPGFRGSTDLKGSQNLKRDKKFLAFPELLRYPGLKGAQDRRGSQDLRQCQDRNRPPGLKGPPNLSPRPILYAHRPSWLLIWSIIALFIQSSLASPDYHDYTSTTKYCYSCMSEDFLLHWQYLDEVYYRPLNFTDHCFKIPAKIDIGMVPCAHSMCITVIEPRILAGQHIGNNIIRGCFSSVFKYGQTPRTQGQQILDTSCMRMPVNKLLPPHLGRRSSNRSVELCWCLGQLCNDYPTVAMNTANHWRLLEATLIFLLSIWV